MHQALAQSFGGMPVLDQTALANFRGIWTATRSNWAALPPENQILFARGVLTAALGEGAADQALGSSGSGQGGGTFEDQAIDLCRQMSCPSGTLDAITGYTPSYE
jgi:hypothetical protein